ncbi:hypothetical protein HAX54_042402, partial [Datura stramonium]|nr:hypothetical protein [Datura stramonium]
SGSSEQSCPYAQLFKGMTQASILSGTPNGSQIRMESQTLDQQTVLDFHSSMGAQQ